MKNKYPTEAEVCESMIENGVIGGEDSRFALIEGFVPTRRDLEMLAHHYLDDVRSYEYQWMAHQTICSECLRESEFAKRRLGSIERILGKDVLDEVLAPVEEEWRKTFDGVKVDLATPMDCVECGEEFLREVLEQDVCQGCDEEMFICQECVDPSRRNPTGLLRYPSYH